MFTRHPDSRDTYEEKTSLAWEHLLRARIASPWISFKAASPSSIRRDESWSRFLPSFLPSFSAPPKSWSFRSPDFPSIHRWRRKGREGGGLTIERTRRHLSSRFISDVIPESGFPSPRFRSTTFPPSILSTFLHFSRESVSKPFLFLSFFLSFSPFFPRSLQRPRNELLQVERIEIRLRILFGQVVKFVNLRKDRESL